MYSAEFLTKLAAIKVMKDNINKKLCNLEM